MPDFTLEPQKTATFRTLPWKDPPFFPPDDREPKPSRVTAVNDRNRFAWTVNIGTMMKIWVKPDGGVAGAPDSAFASRQPYAWFAETPYGFDSPSFAPGMSSQLSFLPPMLGHYTLVVRRKEGGAVVLHVDCIDPALPAPP